MRKTKTCFAVLLAWGLPCFAVLGFAQSEPVAVSIWADRAVVANGYLSIELKRRGEHVATSAIHNLRARKTLETTGDDFVLEYLDGSTVTSGQLAADPFANEEKDADGTERLAVSFHGDGLRLRLLTELSPGHWWAERWLEIQETPKPLARVALARWKCEDARGPSEAGSTVWSLGYPSGCGQVVYAQDLFLGIAHPGAENFVHDKVVSCALPMYRQPVAGSPLCTRRLVIGAGATGDARRAFLSYIDATRPVPARMIFLVNDWYWKDKSKPVEAVEALCRVKQATGVPIDSFTLDDGWDFDWDAESGIWGRMNRQKFPDGLAPLLAAGKPANIGISLWWGPIGGYRYRPRRIEFARTLGYEIYGDRLCTAGQRYREHVLDAFSHWVAGGVDYLKVDGYWPECTEEDHGHPVGPGGAIAQMDSMAALFDAWYKVRPGLLIGYTSGSNPSPFWLQHTDYLWRGGRDDDFAGVGPAFDRQNTYLDSILQHHRATDVPVSAFVTFDLVERRFSGSDDEAFLRGCWWLAARTSLHHDWYVQASDLTLDQWKILAQASQWAKQHERLFRFSRMLGGDPSKGEIYGFSAYDAGTATLALRNPTEQRRSIDGTLHEWLDLPDAAAGHSFQLDGVFGHTASLAGRHETEMRLHFELPPLGVAVFEAKDLSAL